MTKYSFMEYEHVLKKYFREKMQLRNRIHKLKKKVKKLDKVNEKYGLEMVEYKELKEKYEETKRCLDASRNRPATKVVYLRKNPGSVLSNFFMAFVTYGWLYFVCTHTLDSEYQVTMVLGNLITVQIIFITIIYYISNLA